MKSILFFVALLLGSLTTLTAQERFLPFHTTSASAKAALHEASTLWSNAHFSEANALVNKALVEDPDLLMAYTFVIMNDPAAADKAGMIDKALAIQTDNLTEAERILRQQFVIWKTDPAAKATATMKALADAYPTTIEALEWASGSAGLMDDNPDLGLEYALKLMALSPDFPSNYNMMGYFYMAKQQMGKAKASFNKYIELAPKESNAYDSIAEYYMTEKDYGNAAKFYDKADALGMAGAKDRAAKARAMR